MALAIFVFRLTRRNEFRHAQREWQTDQLPAKCLPMGAISHGPGT